MARGCEPPDPRVRRHAAAGPPAFARNALGGAASSVYPFFFGAGQAATFVLHLLDAF